MLQEIAEKFKSKVSLIPPDLVTFSKDTKLWRTARLDIKN